MCRFAAYAGPHTAPAPVGAVLFGGTYPLVRQAWAPRELLSGSVNADGYGIVWYPTLDGEPTGSQRPVRVARAEPVWYDPDLEGLLASARSPVAMAALRNATPGLPVDRAGLLPLVYGTWSFVLNGYVPHFRAEHMRALRSELPDDLYASLQGVSDAETLFLLTVAELGRGASPPEALAEVVGRVRARIGAGHDVPLTMALADGHGVWALNGRVGSGPVNSLYVAERPALAPGGALLASEPLDGDDAWRPVPADAAVVLDARGARVSP
jgi:glutamine amidotransferase